jgi:hypothetical protein
MTKLILTTILAAATLLAQTTINGGRTITGAWDASGASSTKPVKTGTTSAIPGTCAAGDLYWATDGQVGRKLRECGATDTWQVVAYAQGTSAPGTCAVGDIFFDTDATAGANLMLCTSTNTWTAISGGGGGSVTTRDNLQGSTTLDFWPGDPRVIWASDEFMGGTATGAIGDIGWSLSNFTGTGSVSRAAGAWPNIGLLSVNSGATSGNVSSLGMAGSTATLGTLAANTSSMWEAIWVYSISSTSTIRTRVGLGSTSAAALPVGSNYWFGVRYDTNAPDTNFMFVFGNATAETAYDTGIAADTGFHTLRIYSDATTVNKIYLQFDGGTARTICNSGCDITSTGTGWSLIGYSGPIAQVQTDTSAARSVTLDKYSFRARVGSNTAKRN